MTLIQDLRFACRRLRRAPLYAGAVLVTLAVALAANVAVFTAVRHVLLRPLEMVGPDRLVVVTETLVSRGQRVKEVSYRNFVDWRAQAQSFEALAAMGSTTSGLVLDRGGVLTRLETASVSASFFDLLGARPQLGRLFAPADDERGAERVIVLSDGTWRRLFGGDARIVGTRVRLGDDAFTIVGVMPAAFAFPQGAQAWTPLVPHLAAGSQVDTLESRPFGLLFVVGRLKPGLRESDARAELDLIARRLPQAAFAGAEAAVIVTPLLDFLFGPTRRALLLLFMMVGVVWLIACSNVSSLVLARASALRHAFAVKAALGAGRLRLARESLLEMALITAAAGVAGVVLARIGLGVVLAAAPSTLPGRAGMHIDGVVAAFALALSSVTALVCALAPMLHTTAHRLADTVWRTRATDPRAAIRGRSVLAAVQMALAVGLLTAAGLVIRSFAAVQRIDLGFEPQQVLTLDVEPEARSLAEYRLVYDAIIERVAALPQVEAVGAVNRRPLLDGSAGADSGYLLEGQSLDRPESYTDNTMLNIQAVTPGYFEAMRVALRAGRVFSPRDAPDAPPVAIVSERTARRLWPGRDPLGQRLAVAAGVTEAGEYPMQTVVGVVADVRYRGLDDPRFDLYLPATQTQHRVGHLMVRTSGEPASVARSVQAALATIGPRRRVEYVDTMGRVTADALAPWRFSMTWLAALAGAGGLIAVTGLFALVAYSVEQRRRELAVRMALGAAPGAVLRMVVRQGATVAVSGLVAGLVLALVFADRLSSLLFEVTARDAPTIVSVALILALAALAASYAAARRVVRIDPVAAIRAAD